MYALRGIAVSLTFFALIYCLLSVLVLLTWRGLRRLQAMGQTLADLLFLLRVLPLFASAIITFAFVVPSFQLLEPRFTDEGVGTMPMALAIGALSLIACGCYRMIVSHSRVSRVVARWSDGSKPLDNSTNTFVFCSGTEAPPLILVGMRKPRMLVSQAALGLLSEEELHIALKHEVAHIRSNDNLKKLLFRLSPFPGMAGLECAWSQAAEVAADDAAVTNGSHAVELAAALVKLSRLVPVDATPDCTVGFVTGSIRDRVVRLLAWEELQKVHRLQIPRWAAVPPLLVVVVCVFVTYRPVLAATHELTEWLVR